MIPSNDVEKKIKSSILFGDEDTDSHIAQCTVWFTVWISHRMNQGDCATYTPGPVWGKREFEKPALKM